MAFQQTVKDKVVFSGIGLHSGKDVTMTIRPADAGTGVVFHRVDLTPSVSIEASAQNVVNTRLSTTIGKGGAVVSTIEHLMAALTGCGIDNVHVDIDGPEVPIMDGSAAPFVEMLRKVGTSSLSRPKKYLVVKKPITVVDGDKKISIIPSRYYRISFDMRFNHPVVNNQFRSMKFSEEVFSNDYAAARTFGFLIEVETLKANGLARGGSLDNAVVIGDDGIVKICISFHHYLQGYDPLCGREFLKDVIHVGDRTDSDFAFQIEIVNTGAADKKRYPLPNQFLQRGYRGSALGGHKHAGIIAQNCRRQRGHLLQCVYACLQEYFPQLFRTGTHAVVGDDDHGTCWWPIRRAIGRRITERRRPDHLFQFQGIDTGIKGKNGSHAMVAQKPDQVIPGIFVIDQHPETFTLAHRFQCLFRQHQWLGASQPAGINRLDCHR